MDYNTLLDLSTELGYRLAMSGAETFRVEDSINRVLSAYDMPSEVFAIPNCLIVSIETPGGQSITRMKRIEHHGNDLDAVERYSNLSRRICTQTPDPAEALEWLKATDSSRIYYRHILYLLGSFLGAAGWSVFFGGSLIDSLCAGICGVLVGLVNRLLDNLKVNPFFSTITTSFTMAFAAYAMGALHMAENPDAAIIGGLMILVPGLLFTNAMRDIIFGDTNSGTNRIVQVLLISAAIALGTGSAWSLAQLSFGHQIYPEVVAPAYWIQIVASFVGCIGFAILFNIHGNGMYLCGLGGVLSWAAYCLCVHFGVSVIMGNLIAAIVAAAYSEIMARVRKYPAISYLVISIFPMLPGAGLFYTANYLVQGNMAAFSDKGLTTIAIAGMLAVGILLVSTTVRLMTVWRQRKMQK